MSCLEKSGRCCQERGIPLADVEGSPGVGRAGEGRKECCVMLWEQVQDMCSMEEPSWHGKTLPVRALQPPKLLSIWTPSSLFRC